MEEWNLDCLAHGATGPDLPLHAVQADGREEGAEEELEEWLRLEGEVDGRTVEVDLGVGVAVEAEEGDPGRGLLHHLVHRLVLQQVGQPHARVVDVPSPRPPPPLLSSQKEGKGTGRG